LSGTSEDGVARAGRVPFRHDSGGVARRVAGIVVLVAEVVRGDEHQDREHDQEYTNPTLSFTVTYG